MRKARKDHVCNLCGLVIKKGTEYHRQVIYPDGIYNDQIGVFYAHLFCHAGWIRVGPADDWEYFGAGEFIDAVTGGKKMTQAELEVMVNQAAA